MIFRESPIVSGKNNALRLPLHPLRKLVLLSSVSLASIGVANAANPAVGTTTTGQSLNVEISNATEVSVNSPLTVDGLVSLGALSTSQASIVYLVDVSGSTGSPRGLDCNNDGVIDAGDDFAPGDAGVGSTLDCEIGGIIALNDSLQANSAINVAVVAFGSNASVIHPFTTPPNADIDNNGISDINDSLAALDQGGTAAFPIGQSTNFSSALDAAIALFATRPSNEQKIAYLLTDGQDSTGVAEAVVADSAGIRIEGFAVGTGATACAGSTLETIATTASGSCTNVSDISQLIAEISGGSSQPPTGIDRVEVSLNGGPAIDVPINLLGQWENVFPESMIMSGANVIEATVFADDGTQVTAESVFNATILNPPTSQTQICNDVIDMQILASTVSVDPTPTACGPLGTISFSANLENISGDAIDDLFLTVSELSNGNKLCNADNGAGVVGDTYTIGDVAATAPVQQFPFEIGLASRGQFTFFVDAYCEVEVSSTVN